MPSVSNYGYVGSIAFRIETNNNSVVTGNSPQILSTISQPRVLMSFHFFCFSLYEHICDNLERFEVLGCPKTLKQYGLQCHCPFKSGEFQVRNLPLNIPKIHGFARAFIRVRVSLFLFFFIHSRKVDGWMDGWMDG